MKELSEAAQKMLDVALDLFSENGFKGTSTRQIAKETGMTISNIYYYFGNKEGLLYAILEKATHGIVEELREVVDRDLEPLERFKLLVKTHFHSLLEVHRKEAKILFLDEEKLSRLSKPFQVDILNIYRNELRELQSLGIVGKRNITLLAFDIFGVINWHLRWHNPDGPMTTDQISDEMLSFVLYGTIGTPASETV